MPTKKDSALKKKVIKPKKKTTKKKKVTKANKPIVIITQKLPKEKCCTDVKKSGEAYTVPFGFADLAGTRRLGTEVTQKETEVVKPIKTMNEIPKVEKLIPKGPLKIDEGILAKLNQTKPSIPSVADIEDEKPTFKYKPISESFKPIKKSKNIQVNIKEPMKNLIILDEEEELQPLETEPLGEANITKRKYDKSKAEQNKAKLLSQLYNLLVINDTEQNARNITESYKDQSNKKIKEKINYEKQLVKKI